MVALEFFLVESDKLGEKTGGNRLVILCNVLGPINTCFHFILDLRKKYHNHTATN